MGTVLFKVVIVHFKVVTVYFKIGKVVTVHFKSTLSTLKWSVARPWLFSTLLSPNNSFCNCFWWHFLLFHFFRRRIVRLFEDILHFFQKDHNACWGRFWCGKLFSRASKRKVSSKSVTIILNWPVVNVRWTLSGLDYSISPCTITILKWRVTTFFNCLNLNFVFKFFI